MRPGDGPGLTERMWSGDRARRGRTSPPTASSSTSVWSGSRQEMDTAPLLETLLRESLRARGRVHRRVARWSVVQRQRRHAGRRAGGASWRTAVGSRRRNAGCFERGWQNDFRARRRRRQSPRQLWGRPPRAWSPSFAVAAPGGRRRSRGLQMGANQRAWWISAGRREKGSGWTRLKARSQEIEKRFRGRGSRRPGRRFTGRSGIREKNP